MLELVKVREPTKRHTGKKWEAVFSDNGRLIIRRFGQGKNELTGQQEAEDYTMHKSPERRYRYVKRHMKDLRGDPRKPGYLSMFLLWGESTSLKKQIEFYRRMLKAYNKKGTFPTASAERILKEGEKMFGKTSKRNSKIAKVKRAIRSRERKNNKGLRGGKDVTARRKVNRAIKKMRKRKKEKDEKMKRNYVPPKYYANLSKKDSEKQIENIHRAREAYKRGEYISRPKLKSYKHKESRHIVKAKKKFGITSMKDLKLLSKKTGCSVASMEKIISKGKGAYYSGGSRGNQTPSSWAYARLASSITGGPAAHYDKKQLIEGNCNPSIIRAAHKARK